MTLEEELRRSPDIYRAVYQTDVVPPVPSGPYHYQEQTEPARRVAGTASWGRVWEVIDTRGDLFVAFCPDESHAQKIVEALNR